MLTLKISIFAESACFAHSKSRADCRMRQYFLLRYECSIPGYSLFCLLYQYFFSFVLMCIQCLGHFSLFPPSPSLTYPASTLYPPTPSLPGRNYLALISHFVEDNRKEQGFLLVEIRIAIQGVDSHYFPVHMCYILY
jgi:hypothetical protein